jgi:hypothetical protein
MTFDDFSRLLAFFSDRFVDNDNVSFLIQRDNSLGNARLQDKNLDRS